VKSGIEPVISALLEKVFSDPPANCMRAGGPIILFDGQFLRIGILILLMWNFHTIGIALAALVWLTIGGPRGGGKGVETMKKELHGKQKDV